MSPQSELIQVGYGKAKGPGSFAVGREAAVQAMTTITTLKPSMVLAFVSVDYVLDEVLKGIGSVTGASPPVFGATTAGEICNRPSLGWREIAAQNDQVGSFLHGFYDDLFELAFSH